MGKSGINNAGNTQEQGGPGRPFKKGNPGRPKGSLNRATAYKNALFDGIALAAKNAKMTPEQYVAEIMTKSGERPGIMKIGAGFVPKEIKAEVTERVIISMGPDEDCNDDSNNDTG